MLPPDSAPCWEGGWAGTDAAIDMWAHSAVLRTVGALPALHPWRLGDAKGSRRTLRWCARPDGGDVDAVAVLTQYAPDPSLPVGTEDARGLTGCLDVATLVASVAGDVLTEAVGSPVPGLTQWVGGLVRLPGSWLPPLAILPTRDREADDPGTSWGTESLDFSDRHTVHATDPRFASDVLAPHLTALVLDRLRPDTAVTMAGDALHVWWRYDTQTQQTPGRAGATVRTAVLLRDAIPTFVLADHPDRSREVEDRLSARAREAADYRAARDAGHHRDPTLQRIYDRARAEWEAGSPRA